MAALPETSRAFAEVSANHMFGVGDHRAQALQAAVPGLLLGYVPFDPAQHTADQIDVMAPFTEVFGEDQVRLVRPERPLSIQVVTDYTQVPEHPVLEDTKRQLAADLGESLDEALPGMMDYVQHYAVGDNIPTDLDRDVIITPTVDADETAEAVTAATADGLTFVIGSFQTLRFEPGQAQGELIAVKVNHPFDRRIPSNAGRISLGGLVEINTRKPKEVITANRALDQRHQAVVEALKAVGIPVASVIANLQSGGYNAQAADEELAAAVKSVA
jgi:hypothetical protein